MKFAKLIEDPELGQVLATIDTGDYGEPEITYRISEVYGVIPEISDTGFGGEDFHDDSEEAWDRAKEQFNNITDEFLLERGRSLKTLTEGMFASSQQRLN